LKSVKDVPERDRYAGPDGKPKSKPEQWTKMRHITLTALAVMSSMAGNAAAEDMTPASCAALWSGVPALVGGYELNQSVMVEQAGWCFVQGVALLGQKVNQPNISMATLRVRGDGLAQTVAPDGGFRELEVDATGLRVAPKISDRGISDKLRTYLRVQVADVSFVIRWNAQTGAVQLRQFQLALADGTKVTLGADIEGAQLGSLQAAQLSLLVARLTAMDLAMVTKGQGMRPLVEAVAQEMVPKDTVPGRAIEAARRVVLSGVDVLPDAAFDGPSKSALRDWVEALPQPAGKLVIALRAEVGIGAVQVALAAMTDNPTSAAALEAVFSGATVRVDWQPGAAQ
jgi:hypothetical protein